MNTLAPKLILTPLLVAAASFAGRRWGAALSGWVVALPLTSGPIALFIALDLGQDTAARAAAGSLLGATAEVAFCVAFAIAAGRLGWVASLVLGSVAYGLTALLVPAAVPIALYALALVAVIAGLAVMSRPLASTRTPAPAPAWDIPARVAIATLLVVGISALAPLLGGRASGLLATYPVYGAVLATFAMRHQGRAAATSVLRGLTLGMSGFSTFFVVLASLLPTQPLLICFGAALLAGGIVQGLTFPLLKRLGN